MSEAEVTEQQQGGVNVSLPTFEGPLDLLLHLCQKHELEILDIPIAFITEKYLEYLAVMTLIDLDVASEYLVMAATLAHIKSKSLLPADPPGQEDELSEEEQDPRENLIRRLLEYQKYKKAGEDLTSRGIAGRDVFVRGMPIEQAVDNGLQPLAHVPLFSLVEAFQSVLSKSKIKLSHDIVHERVNLVDRINELVDILRAKRRVTFEELFEGQVSRFDLVITFLALLEMTRLRMTRLSQANFDAPIYVEFTVQVGSEEETTGGETSAPVNEGEAIRDALDRNGFVTADERVIAGLVDALEETQQEGTLGAAEAEAEAEAALADDALEDDELDAPETTTNEDATIVDELDEAALAAAWEEEMASDLPVTENASLEEPTIGNDVDTGLADLAVPGADDLDFDAASGSDPDADEETDKP